MSISEIAAIVSEMQEYIRIAEEAQASAEALKDQVKEFMGDNELLIAGPYKVKYAPVTSSRIDTTALKKALPDIAAQYTRTTTTRRFTVQ